MALREAGELPFGELLGALCRSIADGQRALNESSVQTAAELCQQRLSFPARAAADGGGAPAASWSELGLLPTFYQFVETVVDVRLALRVGRSASGTVVASQPVGANYQSTYGYDATVASSLRARLVPVPPTPQAEEIWARAAADPEPGG